VVLKIALLIAQALARKEHDLMESSEKPDPGNAPENEAEKQANIDYNVEKAVRGGEDPARNLIGRRTRRTRRTTKKRRRANS
jgi:hypothetical protein